MAKLIIGPVRLSYLNALEPKANKSGALKYGTMAIIPKTDKANLQKLKKAIQEAWDEGKAELKMKGDKPPASLAIPYRDGDDERPDDPACANSIFFNASGSSKPGIVDRKTQPIDDPDQIYSGMYAMLSLTVKTYNNEGKGITAYLNNIQKVKDGPRLDGKSAAEDDFDELEGFDDMEDDDDDDLGF